MEAKIKQEVGKREFGSIKELKLTKFESSNVVGLSEDWKSLEKLSIVNVGLKSLKGFPALRNLKKLELQDNKLCEGFDALASLPKLQELNLTGNKIKDVEALQPLAEITSLKTLNLKGCDVSQAKDYREKLFGLIKSLNVIDGETNKKSGEENDDDLDDEEEIEDEDEEVDGEDEESLDEEDIDDEEDENEIPLTTLYNKTIEEGEDEEDDDFEAVEEEEEECSDEEDGEEEISAANLSKETVEGPRGKKRKLEGAKENETKK